MEGNTRVVVTEVAFLVIVVLRGVYREWEIQRVRVCSYLYEEVFKFELNIS